MTDLAAVRRVYAEQVTQVGGARDPRVREAFARVPREAFLGPGPWLVWSPEGYVSTESDDPAEVYTDRVIALRPEDRLNNGQPSLHAACIAAPQIRHGDRVLHVGCGTGYYTAILAEMAGPEGRVEAFELLPALAAEARRNLAPWPNVAVNCRSAAEPPLPTSDVIYVNAGASRPLPVWLDALARGGRLMVPLTTPEGWGAVLRVERADEGYGARLVCRCGYIPCLGGRDEAEAARLADTFANRSWREVRSLRRGVPGRGSAVWFAGDGWWLSSEPPG